MPRGGARPGAGRPKGKSPRRLRESFFEALNHDSEVNDLREMWLLFKEVAIQKAQNGDTDDMQWIFGRMMPVPKEHDITQDLNVNDTSGMFRVTKDNDE